MRLLPRVRRRGYDVAPPAPQSRATPSVPPPPSPTASTEDLPKPIQSDAPRPRRSRERPWRDLHRLRGLNVGAALFGWLVTVGIGVLLTALLAAGGTAIGLQQGAVADLSGAATTLTVAGAVLLLLVLTLGYYAGGYVAGRLSRFAGALQGLAVWLLGAVVTGALAAAGAVAGSQYNVLGQLRLPSVPVHGQSLVSGGLVTLAAIILTSLVAAVLGGVVGHRYHVRVDRALARAREHESAHPARQTAARAAVPGRGPGAP